MTVDAHERRLNRINGSIDRTGDKLEKLAMQIDAMRAEQQTRSEVEKALHKEMQKANAKRLSAKQSIVAVIGLVTGFVAAVAAVLSLLSGFGVI